MLLIYTAPENCAVSLAVAAELNRFASFEKIKGNTQSIFPPYTAHIWKFNNLLDMAGHTSTAHICNSASNMCRVAHFIASPSLKEDRISNDPNTVNKYPEFMLRFYHDGSGSIPSDPVHFQCIHISVISKGLKLIFPVCISCQVRIRLVIHISILCSCRFHLCVDFSFFVRATPL